MIITKSKVPEKILEMTKPYKRIFIVGCGTCSTACQTGGEEQVKEMAERLGVKVIGKAVVESPCDLRLVKRDLGGSRQLLEEADALLILSCGAGAQALAEHTGKIIIPGLDTVFVGEIERIGRFYERCRACADCVIYETGGICPVVRCSKGLLNGPCGGMANGKCEASGHTRDCAWVLIYNALKKQGRLDLFAKFRPPMDRSKKAQPQEVVNR
ncbi:MAG: 5,10-methylenetetrahydrofolate reductase [Candidatus Verstraetearchaeota archaeon]|nr:5,10-methylenetetrahydrofolate reductase [Candidatus Verstraetearchaeota archaeon]